MPSTPSFQLTNDDHLLLRALGPTELLIVRSGKEPESVPVVGKQLALIAYLACRPAHAASRAHLVDLLWSDPHLADAAEAFRQTLRELRKKLGPNVLGESGSDPVALSLQIESDRDAFLAAIERDDYERAVEVYRDEFLTGLTVRHEPDFDEWVAAERSQLRTTFVSVATRLTKRWLSEGRATDAIPLAQRARDADPHNEESWLLLLDCLISGQRTAQAEREADNLERSLAEWHRQPSKVVRAAIKRVRNANRSVPDAPARTGVRLVTDLVGRDRELATIATEWRLVSTRRQGLRHIHLTGDAGIGKTRLLDAVATILPDGEATIARVSAQYGARHIAHAFAADIATALAELPGALGMPGWCIDTLATLSPRLLEYFPSAKPDTRPTDETLHRRVEALCELFKSLAAEGSPVILLDDLHWSDSASITLLQAAFAKAKRVSMLVVTTARTPVPDLCSTLGGKEVALGSLTSRDVTELVSRTARLPDEPWAARFASDLWRSTQGAPLLVLGTLQLLTEREILEPTTEGWHVKDEARLFDVIQLGAATRNRVEGLDDAARGILLTLAVVGGPLPADSLTMAVDCPTEDFAQGMDTLERRGLIHRRGNAWTIAHDEYAVAAREAAGVERSRRAAADAGRAMLSGAGTDPGSLRGAARLLAEGGDTTGLADAFARFARVRRLARDFASPTGLATDLLGPSGDPSLIASVATTLPWSIRLGLVSARRGAAVASTVATLVALTAGAIAWGRAHPAMHPAARLIASWPATGARRVSLLEVPLNEAAWNTALGIEADLSRKPIGHLNTGYLPPKGVRPDGKGWTMWRATGDSGVLDIVDSDLHGVEHRITYDSHDDMFPNWAPDAAYLVFNTTRWNARGRANLAVYDTLTRSTRQLTSGDDEDVDPAWSPDGSRIAFRRRFWEGGQAICVIDTDGSGLRCLRSATDGAQANAGWTDSHHVVAEVAERDTTHLVLVDVESGSRTTLQDGVATGTGLASPDGRWVVCQCIPRDARSRSWMVFPVDRPNEFRILHIRGGESDENVGFAWAPATPRLPFVHRVRILPGLGSPIVGVRHELTAAGTDTSGRPAELGIVRWQSLDTAVATVDSAGVLSPHTVGHVRVIASLGGWRADTTGLTITAAPTAAQSLVFEERWTGAIAPTWVPFGEPRPILVDTSPVGPAFVNNGDDSFFSGAYTRRTFDVSQGLWVEFDFSIRLTGAHWDDVVLSLFGVGDSLRFAGWDRRSGDLPGRNSGCGMRYPMGDGAFIGDSLGVTGAMLPAPSALRQGKPVRLTIQLLPDGRCGFAIDGTILSVASRWGPSPVAHVGLEGRSAGREVFVGRLRLGRGLAPDFARPAGR